MAEHRSPSGDHDNKRGPETAEKESGSIFDAAILAALASVPRLESGQGRPPENDNDYAKRVTAAWKEITVKDVLKVIQKGHQAVEDNAALHDMAMGEVLGGPNEFDGVEFEVAKARHDLAANEDLNRQPDFDDSVYQAAREEVEKAFRDPDISGGAEPKAGGKH